MTGRLAQLSGLGVRYASAGAAALSAVDLDIAAGARLAVIGESGSGKSTLALALAGLLPRDAVMDGKIEWAEPRRTPEPGRDIGFVFQDAGTSLNPVLTIGEQIAEVARQHLNLDWRGAYAEARALMEQVHLPAPDRLLRAYPHQLSGGQRQRVAIAAAIAGRPRLLIADEPTSALDTIVQAEIVTLLDSLVAQTGMTLVFVTHDLALASGFVDTIAVLHRGRLVETGLARQLLAASAQDYTRMLLASNIDLATPPLVGEVST